MQHQTRHQTRDKEMNRAIGSNSNGNVFQRASGTLAKVVTPAHQMVQTGTHTGMKWIAGPFELRASGHRCERSDRTLVVAAGLLALLRVTRSYERSWSVLSLQASTVHLFQYRKWDITLEKMKKQVLEGTCTHFLRYSARYRFLKWSCYSSRG